MGRKSRFDLDDEEKQELSQFKQRQKKSKNLIADIGTAKKQRQRNKLRRDLNETLRQNRLIGSCIKYLGCSVQELRRHLEYQFKDGMTWENRGYHGWHMEHIFPLFLADLSKEEDIQKVCHYTNLRPMWSSDHKIKTKIEKQENKDKIINPLLVKVND